MQDTTHHMTFTVLSSPCAKMNEKH